MDSGIVTRLLDKFEIEPKNLNCIVELVKHSRESGRPRLSYILAKGLLSIISKTPDLYAVDLVQLYYELSICCWYMKKIQEGQVISNKLIFDKAVPHHLRQAVHSNITWYLTPLDFDDAFQVPFNSPMLDVGNSSSVERWRPLNPGLFKFEDKLIINCRCVNYNQRGTSYTSLQPDGKIRTRNFLIECDENFAPIKQIEVVDKLNMVKFPKWIEGQEDCRFCVVNNKLMFSSVTFYLTREFLPQIAVSQISTSKLLEAFNNPSQTEILIESTTRMLGPDPGRCEKNWLPFNYNGELHFVYLYDPFVILKPNFSSTSSSTPSSSSTLTPPSSSSQCEVVEVQTSKFDLTRFRGSAAPIEFDNGFLLIVHEVIFNGNGERTYVHRFLWFDSNLSNSNLHVSNAWYLKEPGIEFCSGMLKISNFVYIGAGLKDKEAWIFKISEDKIRSMLKSM